MCIITIYVVVNVFVLCLFITYHALKHFSDRTVKINFSSCGLSNTEYP